MDKLKRFLLCALVSIATLTATAQIPVDKQYHFGAGVVVGAFGTFAANSCDKLPEQSLMWGVASAMTAGIGKELWDEFDQRVMKMGGGFDVKDAGATTFGGVIGAGLSYAALKIFKRPPVIYAEVNKGLQVGTQIKF